MSSVKDNYQKIREDIRQWLKDKATYVSEAYEGSLKVLEDESFPGRINFISHGMREVINRLGEALTGKQGKKGNSQPAELKTVASHWKRISEIKERGHSTKIEIDFDLAKQVDSMVETFKENQKCPSNERLLAEALAKKQSSAENEESVEKDLKEIQKWFQKRTHIRNEKIDIYEKELQEKFQEFEGILYSFVGQFFLGKAKIDEILKITDPLNQKPDLSLISSYDHKEYFFKNLNAPEWIDYLNQKGFFATPPSYYDTGESTYWVKWPASDYLKRMADKEPEKVSLIFEKLEIKNFRVLLDITNAAGRMPGQHAAKLHNHVLNAVQQDINLIYYDYYNRVVKQLIESDQKKEAEEIFRVIFEPTEKKYKSQYFHHGPDLYKEELYKVLPSFLSKRTKRTLYLLCDWLKEFIYLKHPYSPMDSFDDNSHLWRQAIEEHVENDNYELASVMVDVIRYSFEFAIKERILTVKEALYILQKEKYEQLIFKRLKKYLKTEYPDEYEYDIKHLILNEELLDDSRFKHEIARLTGKHFNLLEYKENQQWFEIVNRQAQKWAKNVTNKERKTKENLEDAAKWFKYEKYHWIKDHLQGENKQFYEDMLEKHGEPELSDLNIKTGVGGGRIVQGASFEPPFKKEDFLEHSVEEVIKKIENWKPQTNEEKRFFSKEALRKEFSEYILTDPVSFSYKAPQIKERTTLIVFSFLNAMEQAIKDQNEINLNEVLKLTEWLLQKEGNSNSKNYNEWKGGREVIKSLIQVVCNKSHFKPENYREVFWSLIEQMLKDESSTNIESDQLIKDPRLKDYLDNSLNSPQGRTLHALFDYARWICREIKTHNNEVPDGMKSIPELESSLECLLKAENKTPEVLTVIGAEIRFLNWLDQDWLSENKDRIFTIKNSQGEEAINGWAAWNAYIKKTHVLKSFYENLKEKYALAVNHLQEIEIPPNTGSTHFDYLGEHLLILYARGNIDLDSDNAIFKSFLLNAPSSVRKHTLRFMARILDREKLSREVLDRLMKLWEFYWEEVGKEDASQSHFCTYLKVFTNNQLPTQWRLNNFEKFSRYWTPSYLHPEIFNFLNEAKTEDVKTANQVVLNLLENNRGLRPSIRNPETVKEVLQSGLKDAKAKQIAEKAIDRLGRMGFLDFGDLLEE